MMAHAEKQIGYLELCKLLFVNKQYHLRKNVIYIKLNRIRRKM